MKKDARISLLLAGVMIFSSMSSSLVHADVVIDGKVITDAELRDPNNAAAVKDFIAKYPETAARLLQNNPSSLSAVCDVYGKTVAECQQIVNDTITTTTQSKDMIVVGNQVYTNEWIKNNQAAVVKYITDHPADAATILRDASLETKTAVLKAVNGTTGTMTMDQANDWISKNTQAAIKTGRLVSGLDRGGMYSNVDIDYLAKTMKDGTFNVDGIFVKSHAIGLGFSEKDIREFQDFVATHTAKEIADRIATFPFDVVVKLDEMRPRSSVGIAWRVGPDMLARYLMGVPEAWQNILEYAGIPITKADLDKAFKGTKEDLVAWLITLPNDRIEKIQAYAYNAFDIGAVKPFFESGWDDKSAYDPEIGRIVTAAEKDAIKRIKDYTVLTVFYTDAGHGILSSLGKTKQIVDGPYAYWKPGAFKEYLTEAAIKDYLAHPDKGVFAGGSGTNYCWKDQACATAVTTSTTPKTTTGSTTSTGTITTATGVVNPYASSLSVATKKTLDAWITKNILPKATTLTATNYLKLLDTIIVKLEKIKAATPTSSKNKISAINYLTYELQKIIDTTDDSASFLDDLLN